MLADIHNGRCFIFFTKDWLIDFTFYFMKILEIVCSLLNTLNKTAFFNKISRSEVFCQSFQSNMPVRNDRGVSINIIRNVLHWIHLNNFKNFFIAFIHSKSVIFDVNFTSFYDVKLLFPNSLNNSLIRRQQSFDKPLRNIWLHLFCPMA